MEKMVTNRILNMQCIFFL